MLNPGGRSSARQARAVTVSETPRYPVSDEAIALLVCEACARLMLCDAEQLAILSLGCDHCNGSTFVLCSADALRSAYEFEGGPSHRHDLSRPYHPGIGGFGGCAPHCQRSWIACEGWLTLEPAANVRPRPIELKDEQ